MQIPDREGPAPASWIQDLLANNHCATMDATNMMI